MSRSNHKNQEGWANLPNDLVELIMSKLMFVDQLNFRAVCKPWSIMDEVLPAETRLPWLMILGWSSCKLIDTTYRKTYSIDMIRHFKEVMNIRSNRIKVHASKDGWLLVSSPGSSQIFMWTPLYDRNNFIELPVLNSEKFSHATFTSSPHMNPRCKFIALKVNGSNSLTLNTCFLGDKSWSTQYFECRAFSISEVKHWMYSEGILYFATGNDRAMGTFDIAGNRWSLLPLIPNWNSTYEFEIFDVALKELVSIPVPPNFLGAGKCLVDMVKSNGELFVIHGRSWIHDQRLCFGGKTFKLDLTLMTWDDGDHPNLDYLFMRKTEELGGPHVDLNTDWEDMERSFSRQFLETTIKPCPYKEQVKDYYKLKYYYMGLPHIEVRSYVNNGYAALAAHRSLRRLWIDRLISCSNCSSSYLG